MSLSPINKGNYRDKSYDRIATTQSADERKGISSPRNTRGLNSSATMDNSNVGIEIYSSSSSNNVSPRKQIMTETEISSMVHDALIRARKSTKSSSPRSPRSHTKSLSPRSIDALSHVSTQSNRPIAPTLSATSPSNGGRPPMYSPSSSASPTKSRPPVYSFSSSPSRKQISVPSLSVASEDSIETPFDVGGQLSMQSALTDDRRSESCAADQSASTFGSLNSSDDIVRRVEEEIANARKAAKEATMRLAGVSANFRAKVESMSVPTRSNIVKDDDRSFDDEIMGEAVNASSSTDVDGNFNSALNEIGTEFDEIFACRSETINLKKTSVMTEEKKEDDANKSPSTFVRTRSIAVCSLDSIPADELNTFLAEGSEHDGNDGKSCSSPIKTHLSINRSIGDNYMDELEMMLSDEREQDLRCDALTSTETTSIDEDDEEDATGNVNAFLESNNASNAETASFDQDETEELTEVDQTILKPETSNNHSKDTSTLGEIPCEEVNEPIKNFEETVDIKDTTERMRVDTSPTDTSLDDRRTEVICTKSSGHEDLAGVTLTNMETTSIDEDDEEEDATGNVNDFLESNNASNAETASFDQDETEELIETDQTTLSPETLNNHSKDTATLGEIPCEEVNEPIKNLDETMDIKDTAERMRVDTSPTDTSLDDRRMEVICAKSSGHEDLAGVTSELENLVTTDGADIAVDETVDDKEVVNESSIDNTVVPEEKEDRVSTDVEKEDPVSTDVENLPTTDASNDDFKIQHRDDETTISSPKNSICDVAMTDDVVISDDQVTEIIDNKDHLTNRLLNNLSVKRDENMLSIDLTKQLPPVISGSKTPSSKGPASTVTENRGNSINRTGEKVKFRQRYPVPPKIKNFRQPSEIISDYQLEKPSDKLWISVPKKDLKELLEAVTGTSIQRRSNACGALKVMSTQKKNQLTLVRTEGFMDALVLAISDNYSIESTDAGIAARTRAVSVVLNVSARKDNRYHVIMHPGLRESLVKCMIEDKAEARTLACAALATLAKSQHCREPMAKTGKLVDTLANILKKNALAKIDVDRQAYLLEEKIDYSGDDERSRVRSNTFSSASASSSSSTRSSFGEDSMGSQQEDPKMIRRTRMNACAALLHLSKECSVSQELCASNTLLFSLVSCCKEVQHPIHTKCLEILANLTRFPENNAHLVQFPDLVDALIVNGYQQDDSDRLWAMRIFQNLSSEPSAKARLASAPVLELLSTNMMRKHYGEQLAATSTMYNISTEPGAVVPLTNVKNVVATLVHVAHSPTSQLELRTIACDALATLGLWLQTLASSGTVPEEVKSVPLPTYITSGWQRWND